MGAFEYRQAEEIRDTFARHQVRYLFIGKSGAFILGYPSSKVAANRAKDREGLDRLRSFRDYWMRTHRD
jgi:hypothetical protein